MTATKKSAIAFTYAFAIVLLFFLFPNINANAAAAPSQNNSSLSSAKIAFGQSVTIYGRASGGTGDHYEYLYQYQAPGTSSFITLSDYSRNSSISFTPSQAGTYTIRVNAKTVDSGGSSSAVTKSLSLNVVQLNNTSSVSASSITIGDSVTITGSATGGSGYQYKYTYSGEKNGYISPSSASSQFTSSASVNFKPSQAGTYTITVEAKDTATGAVSQKQFSLRVNEKITAMLENKSSISATSCFQGKGGITLTGSASGGNSPYMYSYGCKKQGESSWTYIGEQWTNKTAVNLDPEQPGIYEIQIKVKDKKNVLASASFTLTVKKTSAYTRENLASLYKDYQDWYYQLFASQKEEIKTNNKTYKALADAAAAAETALNNSDNNQDWDTLYINLNQEFEKAKENPPPATELSYSPIIINTVTKWLGIAFKSLGNALFALDDDGTSSGLFAFDAYGFANSFSDVGGIINIFASSLIVLLWAVNILNSAMQSELFTMKGTIKAFGYLMFAKIWVDLSLTVCYFIYQMCHELLGGIIASVGRFDFGSIQILSRDAPTAVNVWSRAWLLDFLMYVGIVVMALVMLIPFFVFIGMIFVKLCTRNFEIGLMMVVSPVFFACLAGDETKEYFKRFITSFISVVAELLYMAIVYAAFMYYLHDWSTITLDMNNLTADGSKVFFGFCGFGIAFFAACILMKKPPRILRNLVS